MYINIISLSVSHSIAIINDIITMNTAFSQLTITYAVISTYIATITANKSPQ
jgi:hypothetical protein